MIRSPVGHDQKIPFLAIFLADIPFPSLLRIGGAGSGLGGTAFDDDRPWPLAIHV